MSTQPRMAVQALLSVSRDARSYAAHHLGIDDLARVEPMTAHETFTEAVIEQARVNAAGWVPDGNEVRICPTPAGVSEAWMLVCVLPEQAYPVHPTLGPVTADELARADEIELATPIAA